MSFTGAPCGGKTVVVAKLNFPEGMACKSKIQRFNAVSKRR